MELTVRETNSANPVFMYDPATGEVTDGWAGRGPVVMAVDKLPAEFRRALIAHAGELTLEFSYLHDDLLRGGSVSKESRDS